MSENRRLNVDTETRVYLEEFKAEIIKQFKHELKATEEHIKEVFDTKMEPMGEHIVSNSIDIKMNAEKTTKLQIETTKLDGRLKILEDNKDTSQKQAAIAPSTKYNYIAIIFGVLGVCGVVFTLIKG